MTRRYRKRQFPSTIYPYAQVVTPSRSRDWARLWGEQVAVDRLVAVLRSRGVPVHHEGSVFWDFHPQALSVLPWWRIARDQEIDIVISAWDRATRSPYYERVEHRADWRSEILPDPPAIRSRG